MDEILEDEEILDILYRLPEDPATSDVEGDSEDDFGDNFVDDIISEVFPPSTSREDSVIFVEEEVQGTEIDGVSSKTLQVDLDVDSSLHLTEHVNNQSEQVIIHTDNTVGQSSVHIDHNYTTNNSIVNYDLGISSINYTKQPIGDKRMESEQTYYKKQKLCSDSEGREQSSDKVSYADRASSTNQIDVKINKSGKTKNLKCKIKRKPKSKEKKSKSAEERKQRKQQERDEGWEEDGGNFAELSDALIHTNPKSTLDFSVLDKEIEYFNQFYDDAIIQHICDQTNLYALQNNSRKWTNIGKEELRAFFGITIIMGIHVLPSATNYWSSDPFLSVPGVSQVMTLNRYKKIVQNLHINDNNLQPKRADPGFDKLYKLRPLIVHLEAKCLGSYNPSKNLVVDEAMVGFKGRSTLKQYQPKKPVKRGYKVWCLADSQTGYVLCFDIYTGKTSARSTDDVGVGDNAFLMCEKVVLSLCRPFFGTKRLVAIDNFFTTFQVLKTLLQNGLYACGTVRADRAGLPTVLSSKEPKFERGQFTFRTKEGICAVKWRDNKDVCFLSSFHDPKDIVFVTRKEYDGSKIEVPCPKVVKDYNAYMGGVDNFDQHRERYHVGRRSRKWWHRLLYFLIELGIVNSFNLFKVQRRGSDHLRYRINLARQLISGFSSRKSRGVKPKFTHKKPGHVGVPQEVRLQGVGIHIPKESGTRRRCRLCSTKVEEKRTKIICAACEVPLSLITASDNFTNSLY